MNPFKIWSTYLNGFNLLTLTNIGFGSKLLTKTKRIILLGKQYYTLNGPNQLFLNFPRCVFSPLGNHKTSFPNWNFFYVFFYQLHKNLFQWFAPTLFWTFNLFFCNFSNSIILVVGIMVGSTSLWSPLIANRTCFIGMRKCKP